LREWNINIYRGVLTGFNEAFIIRGYKRNEILSNCKDEAERNRTDELIRPILRGRDIKRYSYEFADLWLINIHNGVKEKGIKPIDINDYPAVRQHLDKFLPQLKKRQDKGDTPYNLRNCAYIDLFYKQKICWKAVGRNLTFALVEPGIFLTAPASFIYSDHNEYILAFLSSNVGKYFIYQNSDTTGAGDIMLNIQSLTKFPIPLPSKETVSEIKNKILNLLGNLKKGLPIINLQKEIDAYIYTLYEFNNEEVKFIESQ
jgi:hypothetical protein